MRELEQFAESVARMSSQPTMLEHRATVKSVSASGITVRIDGAESDTICTTWLATCHVGDRVIVTIDPHKRSATVKGNMSNVPISDIDITDVPEPATTAPNMDGAATVGTSDDYARADHVHPTDTSRAAASHTHAISDVTSLQSTLDGKAASLHTHGSITNVGAITSDTTAASGDKLIISDSSDSSKLKRSGIAIGTDTTTFLRNDGTWAIPDSGNVTLDELLLDAFDVDNGFVYTEDGYGSVVNVVPVANGGTGASTAAQARVNLGLASPLVKIAYTTVSVNMTAGSNASVTAASVTGYTFVGWVSCATNGWVASCYVADPTSSSSTVYVAAVGWKPSGTTGQVRCAALYEKNL